jgi:iron complex outermembrane recepter protein
MCLEWDSYLMHRILYTSQMHKLLVLFLLSPFSKIYSQNSVSGNVSDSSGVAIPFCPLGLFNSSDSTLIKGNLSDSAGNYKFTGLTPGIYFIKYSYVGYKNFSSEAFNLDSNSQFILKTHILKTEGTNLKEVSVLVLKPLIEFKKGMIVMNVENDILAKGNTVLELLKRIPGVIVDAQNNISINGSPGARFLIDDRLQQMPAPQVIDMLLAMSADAVSKIELIKNPPARFDAAGTGGLINIVTRKSKVKGYNGNIGFGISEGQRLRFGPNASFNFKSDKLSIFTNFSYGNWDGISHQEFKRTLERDGSTESINTLGIAESFQKVFWGSGGIEYDLTKKTVLGFYINGNHNDDFYLNNSETNISNSNAFNYGKLVYKTDDYFNQSSPNYNLSLVHKLDSAGGQIRINAGYNNFLERNTKLNVNRFYNNDDVEIAPVSTYHNLTDRNFKVFTQKADLNKTFKNKLSIESGLKSTFTNNLHENELIYSNQSTGYFIGDTTFYNSFRYKERILAAYTTLSRSWDKINISLGLRAEETDIHANNLKTDYTFNRKYFNIFPSGSIDLTLSKKHTISTAYSYHIDRPHYGMLNPVRIFNEQLNYSAGNPELKPQFTHHVNLDYNYNQFITQSVGVDKTKDFTYWYTYSSEASRVNVDTISNVADRNNLYYSVSAQKRIKWYSFQTYAVVMYRTMSGELLNQSVSSEIVQLYFNLNQEFYLPKDFKIQIWAGRGSGFQDAIQYYYPRSAVHISVQKTFMNNKLFLSIGLNDVFYKDNQAYTSMLPDQYFYWFDRNDTRRLRFTINYRFGKMRFDQKIITENDSRIKGGK